MKRALAVLVTLFAAAPLLAWGEKGHYIVNEAATASLPTDMPAFFYQAFPQLVWTAYDPDRWRGAGPSLDAANGPDHFLDYEYVAALKLPPDRYKFIALLGTTGTLRRHGLENSWTGFLPWRIAELSERLTNEWRQWRFAPRGSRERAFIEADIIRDAGVLGHFVGDASNPHHATFHYNGWAGPNPNGYPIDCNTHDRFERYFVSHSMAASDVWPRVKPPVLRTDYFAAALEEVRESNSLVEPLYRLDRDGAFALVTPPSPQGVDFAGDRLAAGAGMLRDLWWSTWKNSEKAPKRGAPED
jgi:hypothetical protein